jgi:hypothetical protein
VLPRAGDTTRSSARTRAASAALRPPKVVKTLGKSQPRVLAMGASCRWHVPCSSRSSDTGTAAKADGSLDSKPGEGSSRGKKIRHGRPMGRSAPPSAQRSPANPGQVGIGFFRVHRHPGARTRFRAVSARERGVRATRVSRSSSSVVAVPFTVRHKKTKYARSTKPGEQRGSSRSLPVLSGRGSPKVEQSTGKAAFSIFIARGRHPTRRDLDARRGPT